LEEIALKVQTLSGPTHVSLSTTVDTIARHYKLRVTVGSRHKLFVCNYLCFIFLHVRVIVTKHSYNIRRKKKLAKGKVQY